MSDASTNLFGLAVAIRLKTDLLRLLARSPSEEWQGHASRFVNSIAASDLEDGTALFVLLADLREEIRVLLGQSALESVAEHPADGRVAAYTTDAPSKSDILEQFQSEVDALLAGAAGRREIASPLVEHMLRFIEDHYADALTLDMLAAAIGRSKRHAATLFRQHTGHTVHGFLTQVRVHHATDLIRAGVKIEAVSLLVGYRSKKNFYRHFKEQVGVTPFVYRTAMLGLLPRQARTPQE